MVIYQYRCPSCKTGYEEPQEVDAEHTFSCPKCGKQCDRVWSLAGFSFDFKAGFDVGQGKWFDSARQRDTEADRSNLRRIKAG